MELGYNNITEIKGFENLPELEDLVLEGNKIQRIPHLGALKNLECFFIQRNRLDHVADLKNVDGILTYISENPVAKEINEKYGGTVDCEGSDGKLMWSEELRRELYGYL